MNKLQEIIVQEQIDLARRKSSVSVAQLQESPLYTAQRRSLVNKFASALSPLVIAEFKRRSPSHGDFPQDRTLESVVQGYEKSGAAALSILTNRIYFGGELRDVTQARGCSSLPILRKEFIVDEYQLYEARGAGADIVLLIGAALEVSELRKLGEKAHELGLEVLYEAHSKEELAVASEPWIDIVGVNNRNLKTLTTDIEQSIDLFSALPSNKPCISESGIRNSSVANRLAQTGYRGFLIGEYFLEQPDPGEALKEFIAGVSL